jgi:Mg/Co/Ni transporter MgtE
MTEQVRRIDFVQPVDTWHIDGEPYSFSEGQTAVVPRGVANRLTSLGKATYAGDIFTIDDEEFDDVIGVEGDEPDEKQSLESFINDASVDEIADKVDELSEEEIKQALDIEERNQNRKTAVELLESELDDE